MIRCKECGQFFNKIQGNHLRAKHGITVADYKAKYPGAPIESKALVARRRQQLADQRSDPTFEGKRKQAQRQMLVASWQDPDYRSKMVQVARDNWNDPVLRDIMSEAIRDLWSQEAYQKMRSQTSSQVMKDRWQDPEQRALFSKVLSAAWTPDRKEEARSVMRKRAQDQWKDPKYRKHMITLISQRSLMLWQDPEFRKKMFESKQNKKWNTWTKPERKVRRWLRMLGVYRLGSRDEVLSFFPHGWVGGGLFNADFVDYNHKLIIHVDGVYWHSLPNVQERDARNNQWCQDNGWAFLRITDTEILKKPKTSRKRIQAFLNQPSVR